MAAKEYQEIIDRLDRIEAKLGSNPQYEHTLDENGWIIPYCDHTGSYHTSAGWYCPRCGRTCFDHGTIEYSGCPSRIV